MTAARATRALLVFNPAARGTTRRIADNVATLLSPGRHLEVATTEHPGHALQIARTAVAEGFDAVFSLGGDGTVNELAQGLVGSDIALGVVPGGGANVLARTLGLPNDARQAAAHLQRGTGDRRISLGRVNDRWFVCNAGLGFDAAVVRHVERHQRFKRRLGQAAFVWSALAQWTAVRRASALVDVEIDEVAPTAPVTISIVANTAPYTFLGTRALRVHPDASFDQGLDLLTVTTASTRRLLRILGHVLSDGAHVELPEVTYHRNLSTFTLHAPRPLPLMADGEYLGSHSRAEFGVRRDALRVLT
ncbi:MAG: diacylglycerol kinase family protein [Nitriliruptoraceae bacterium]